MVTRTTDPSGQTWLTATGQEALVESKIEDLISAIYSTGAHVTGPNNSLPVPAGRTTLFGYQVRVPRPVACDRTMGDWFANVVTDAAPYQIGDIENASANQSQINQGLNTLLETITREGLYLYPSTCAGRPVHPRRP